MYIQSIIWDLDDDPDGNIAHVAEHGLTPAEVDNVLLDPDSEFGISRSSRRTAVWGSTNTGRYIMVIFELLDDGMVYPVTAFDAEE